nr:MAG TPA: PROTEIN/DNA Complex catalytic motif, Helix-turn-helix DNA [Caudoviricetes sp.]
MDGNIKNNHFTNLEWCTAAYNTRYSYTHLGRKGNHTTDIKCKLKVDDKIVGEFNSIKEAAEYANKHYSSSISSLRHFYKTGNVSIEKCND